MILEFPKADPADRAVGGRVKALREARGVSRERLAARMGLDPELLGRAEMGRAHLSSSQLYAVTLELHVPMRLLFESGELPRMRPV
jgi:transcriptional regulator with XRE-family HTH domain